MNHEISWNMTHLGIQLEFTEISMHGCGFPNVPGMPRNINAVALQQCLFCRQASQASHHQGSSWIVMDHPMALAIPQKVAQGSGRGRLASMEDLRFSTELTQPGGLRFPLLCLITGYHWYPIYWNILETWFRFIPTGEGASHEWNTRWSWCSEPSTHGKPSWGRVKMKSDASIRQTNKTFDGCFQVCASIKLDHLP